MSTIASRLLDAGELHFGDFADMCELNGTVLSYDGLCEAWIALCFKVAEGA